MPNRRKHPELRRVHLSIMLPAWLARHLRGYDESVGRTVERAVIRGLRLKPPAVDDKGTK